MPANNKEKARSFYLRATKAYYLLLLFILSCRLSIIFVSNHGPIAQHIHTGASISTGATPCSCIQSVQGQHLNIIILDMRIAAIIIDYKIIRVYLAPLAHIP